MASEHWPTYVILAIYVLLTVIVTIAAKKKNSDPDDHNTEVSKHFLGSKNFGPILLTFTTFASVFSGYTVVGVPTEAGVKGFFAVRWMGLIIAVGVAMLWLYPRLRRLSIVREYESPGQFVQDRYQSRSLSILVAVLLCVPQILYIGINLFSLGNTLEALTGGELNFYAVVAVSTIMILVFEALGGMRSVAYTDAVEAIVMVSIFVTVPIMITCYYGGFVGQVSDTEDLPCSNSYDEDSNGCLNYAVYELPATNATNTTLCEASALNTTDTTCELSEYFLRSPSSVTILNYVLFVVGGLSFSLNPHILQRALTAKDDSHVRVVVVAVFLVTFITMTPGLLTGITALSNEWEGGAFAAMLENFEERGGFAGFISALALLAGIAGIMSTADSALIGVSNTLSVDVFKNHVLTDWSSQRIVYVGKGISLLTMSLCLGFACWLYNTDEDYGSVYTVQQGLLWQAVPAYAFGLYTNLSGNAVLAGTASGTLTCFIMIICLFANEGAHDPLPLVDKAWSTFTAVAINVVISLSAHLASDFLPIFTPQNGADILSLSNIREIMAGISEPVTRFGGVMVWAAIALPIVATFHWIGNVDPELIEEYGEDYAAEIMFNGEVRSVIGGVPDYIFATLMWYVVAVALGVAATLQWDVHFAVTKGTKTNKQHVAQESTVPESVDMNGTEDAPTTNGTEDAPTTNGSSNGTTPLSDEIETEMAQTATR